MLVWLISSSRSRSVTEAPPFNTHTLNCVGEIHFPGSVFIYFFFLKLSSVCFNFKRSRGGLPDTGPGGGQRGMNWDHGYVVINIIVFIFNGYSEFDRE